MAHFICKPFKGAGLGKKFSHVFIGQSGKMCFEELLEA